MTFTAAFCDYDNDGDPDLFVGYRGSASWLYRNLGAGKFEKVQVGSLPVPQSESGIWADFNNDGYFDLFTTTSVGVLHLNLAGQGFEDVTELAFGRTFNMTVWGPAWGDYDNDGDLDLFIPDYDGPNLMFQNNGDGTLTSIDVGQSIAGGNHRLRRLLDRLRQRWLSGLVCRLWRVLACTEPAIPQRPGRWWQH